MMRSAIALNGSYFNTQRMISQYVRNAMQPPVTWPCSRSTRITDAGRRLFVASERHSTILLAGEDSPSMKFCSCRNSARRDEIRIVVPGAGNREKSFRLGRRIETILPCVNGTTSSRVAVQDQQRCSDFPDLFLNIVTGLE